MCSTPSVSVFDVECRAPQSGCADEEQVSTAQLILTRRGVFGVTRGRDRLVAEPNVAVVFEAGSSYAVDHPGPRGDRCTVLTVADDLLDEALGASRPSSARISDATQLASRAVGPLFGGDEVDAEERALRLLDLLSQDFGRTRSKPRVGGLSRKRVEDARALIAAEPEARWTLTTIADALHVSPFHLARQFRAVTGSTIGAYLLRLRLAAALDRITDGETSLSAVAADCGFAHHSHFTDRFRAVFGITPSCARRRLTSGGLAEMRERLAEPGSPAPR